MKIISTSALQTKKLGQLLAEELSGSEVICLAGDLGSGKTTFTQGLLKGLKVKGPYTSPTFTIVKEYTGHKTRNIKHGTINAKHAASKKILHAPYSMLHVFHIDAYRISAKDLRDLGFLDFAGQKNCLVILEWPEKVKRLIPTNAVWINFQWVNEKERGITFDTK